MRVRVGGKPLFAIQAPNAILFFRDCFQCAYIGPTGFFRHPLSGAPHVFHVRRHQLRQKVGFQLLASVRLQHMNGRIRHVHRAHHPDLGLREHVTERVLHQLRYVPRPTMGIFPMAHRVNLKVLEPNLFHLVIGRMVFDTVEVAAEAVALLQHWRVLVDQT